MHPGCSHAYPGGADGRTEETTKLTLTLTLTLTLPLSEETTRKLAVCWSPRLPYTSCAFEVCHDGVRGCA